MFDIPFELFIGFIGLCLSFLVIGLAWNPKIPILIMLAGLMIFPMISLTDNLIMGYSDGSPAETQYILQNTTSDITASLNTTTTQTTVFNDDYTTNTGWSQVGTLVTVDSGTADKVHWVTSGSTEQRVYKSLGTTLLATQSFTVNFEFTYTSSATPNDIVIALTAGNGAPMTANQDALGVYYRTSTNTGFNIFMKDDAGAFTQCQIPNNANSAGITYYGTFKRLNGSISSLTTELDIYTDSARTLLVSGYPHYCSSNAGIGDFTYLQHGKGAVAGALTADLDNLVVTAGVTSTIVIGDNISDTQYNYDSVDIPATEATANLYPFDEYPKLLFGMLSMSLVFIGALIYWKEK